MHLLEEEGMTMMMLARSDSEVSIAQAKSRAKTNKELNRYTIGGRSAS